MEKENIETLLDAVDYNIKEIELQLKEAKDNLSDIRNTLLGKEVDEF